MPGLVVPPVNGVRENQRGSAVAEFVMVSALLIAVFLAILQLTLALHVRNTLMDAAAAGARYGTLADRGPGDGAGRTQDIIRSALNDRFASNVHATAISIGGSQGVRITVRAGIPLFGMIPFVGEFVVHGESVRYG
jgi:Flp pilus assembly protein TadG